MKKVTVYTDGACSGNPGPGAYGAVLLYRAHRKEISGGYRSTTNNRMEILAVIKGLELLKEPCDVQVVSDSRYVVDAVEKKWLENWQRNCWMRTKTDRVMNVDLWKQLLGSMEQHKVSFRWVKGHAAHPENERCDYLARECIRAGALAVDEEYEKGV